MPKVTLSKVITTKVELSQTIPVVTNTAKNFKAGKNKLAIANWFNITSDKKLLSWVTGVSIDFDQDVNQQVFPAPIKFCDIDKEKMGNQLEHMLSKGVIEVTLPSQGQFISNVFCRPKKDGTVRIILNLKHFLSPF